MQNQILRRISLYCLLLLCVHQLKSFQSTQRYSDAFYAAQKYFYQEAKHTFPKLSADKNYPEVPIKGNVSAEELKTISALQDFFDARRIFLAEAAKYPEQLYPEVFSFLLNHPGLSQTAGNKTKQQALEKYFAPFFFLFSSDKHYRFHPDIKQNPCPFIFLYKDDKKNSFSIPLSNGTKSNFEFNVSESPSSGYVYVTSKKPISLKAGASVMIKLSVDIKKLKSDTLFRILNLVLSDPTQPKVRLNIPVILLPSKDYLNLPPHLYDFNFSYSTFFKHISLQKEKSSWPEACPNNDCAGKRVYAMRSADKVMSTYTFGDLCTVQYNVNTGAAPLYSHESNTYKFSYTELGNLQGEERNCVDTKTGLEIYCPSDAPNNGKEIYGQRKLECHVFVPQGKTVSLTLHLKYSDLQNQVATLSELSWLQEKVLLLRVTDAKNKEVMKEILPKHPFQFELKGLEGGSYTLEIFPFTEDGKIKPSFNIQHLNHGGSARFEFNLSGTIKLVNVKKS